MMHLFSPGARRGPGLCIGFEGIGPAVEEKLHQIGESPTAGPPERRALQQVIADVEPTACIEHGRCEANGVALPVADSFNPGRADQTLTNAGPTGGSPVSASGAHKPRISPTAVRPGNVLGGRYEILKQLGEGGMGTVYEVRDRELDRCVAMKVIRPDLAQAKHTSNGEDVEDQRGRDNVIQQVTVEVAVGSGRRLVSSDQYQHR